jgi:hypothetical protein
MTFRSAAVGTEVTHTAEFTFKAPARLLAPCSGPPLSGSANKRRPACAKP